LRAAGSEEDRMRFYEAKMAGFAGGKVLVDAANMFAARAKANALAAAWGAELLWVAPRGSLLAAAKEAA
jgi:hypothetical protein